MHLLAAGFLIHFLRHGMVFPLIPLYAQSLGAMESRIGLVVACFHLLSIFLAIPLGSLMERFGLRFMLACGAGSNLVYSLLLLAANSLWILIVAQLAGGLGFLLLIVATQTYVGSQTPNHLRERGFGLITLAAAVGQTLGPALGGFLFSWAGYMCVFLVAVALAGLGAGVVAVPGVGYRRQEANSQQSSPLAHIQNLAGNVQILTVLAFTFSVMVVVSLRGSFLPLLLQEKGISEGQIGLLLSCFALAMTLVRVVVGRVLGRTTRLNVLTATLACVIVGSGALPFVDSMGILAVFLTVYGIGFGFSQPLSMVMISDISSSGLAMGMRFFTISVAIFLSSLSMGWVAEHYSLAATFYFGAVFLIVAGTGIVLQLAANGARHSTNREGEEL
ncbi:MAG: MFS transporter [Desulfovermiculus sp.]|nr:MFS transporter [Desulfovermiculus sp.]